VNDELALSLYLDGRLPAEARRALEARLAREPRLRAELDALRGLQRMSERLVPAEAAFSADDIRVRAQLRRGGGAWWRVGVAAAAVIALAVTHVLVYRVGAERGAEAERREQAQIAETEALLERAAAIDVAAPHERLEDNLATLRQEIPARLAALADAGEPRAANLVDTLRQMEIAFEQHHDPGFLGLSVSLIASGSLSGEAPLRFLPASATNYARVAPAGEGRYRIILVTNVNGTPSMVTDEGTPEELEARHDIRIVPKGR